MTLGPDFRNSYSQIRERQQLLDNLNYGALLSEATAPNGKAELEKYQNTEDSIEYSLHFMRDREELLEYHIPNMFAGFKKTIDKYKNNSLWTLDQWREYRSGLDLLTRTFEIKLREFATAYGFTLTQKQANNEQIADTQSLNPEPQQMALKDLLPEKLKTDEAVGVFQKAIDAQLITYSPEGLKWNNTKQLLAYFATKVSEKFRLTTILDKDGKKTTAWKPFETLFNKQGLKGTKQNWMRLNTKFEPTGFEEVDALF